MPNHQTARFKPGFLGVAALLGWIFLTCAPGILAQNLIWDDGATTGNWNLTDANWTGSLWVNGPGENAIFTNATIGGTVNLTVPITAGTVTFGNAGLNASNVTFINNSLQAAGLTVQGKNNNGGAYANNPTLTIGNSVSIAGNVAVGRANLNITNGTFSASQILSAPGTGAADWANVTVTNATVWVTNGILGSANTTATFQLNLNGGTLYTPYLNLADREAGANNNAWFNWNGGTVIATSDTNAFITLYGGSQNIYIGNGGAILNTFDGTTAHSITIGIVMKPASGSNGGLTKLGQGTLNLTNVNTYTGATTINGGTLALSGAGSIAQSPAINVLAGGTLDGSGLSGGLQVASGQTLAGNGAIAGAVTVGSGATLQPGLGGADTSTLTFNSTLTLNGSTFITLNRANAQNSSAVTGVTTLTYGGTLSVLNAGPPPQVGDVFTLFSATSYYDGFTGISLPPLASGLVWNTSQLLVNGSISVQAAPTNNPINWGMPVTITGDGDVSTNGGLLYAYDDSNLPASANGVNFTAGNSPSSFGGNVTISGAYWYNTTAFGSMSGLPWDGLSMNYQSVLQGGVYASSGNTLSITLNNLIAGHPYLVQIWVNDTRSGASNRTETVTSSGGNTVTLDYNNTSANGGVGQYAIGTFTADAATQTFTLTGAQPVTGNSAQLNAIQVRDQSAANGSLVASVTMNPATTYQTIYGFGGNFCQGDQKLLSSYKLYPQVFSPSGLNFSFIRLSTSLEVTNVNFAGYDAANVAVITNFRAMQPNGYITLSQWSPPENLKNTGSVYGGTLAKVGGQYVYTDFANWWTRVLTYYQTNAALPDYVSIQNEPDFASSGTNFQYQAGSYLSATETSSQAGYPQALAAVRSAFAASGLGSQKILGPDTTATAGGKISNYLTNTAPATVDAIGHHLYGDAAATTGTGNLSALNAAFPYTTIPKFMTEGNPFDDQEKTFMPTNPDWMHLAVTIHNYMTIENANAYLVWNVMYATVAYWTGQPNGTQTYYPLGHFSKFVRPGDRRANVVCSDPNLLVSLYRRTNSNPAVADVLVMVLINDDTNYVTANINTSGYWATDPLQRSWQVYKTANDGATQQRLTLTENLAGAGLSDDRTLELASNSITTVIINTGVYTNAPPVFTSTAASQSLNPGQTLLFTNTATDPNQPAQTLTFSLLTKPSGATINAASGVLGWRPLIAQANTVNPFSVVVADNGTPSLSATQNFTVTVLPVTVPAVSSSGFTNGQFEMQVSGASGPDYTIQASTNLLTWTNLLVTNPVALPFGWSDTNTAGLNQRFYRVLLGP